MKILQKKARGDKKIGNKEGSIKKIRKNSKLIHTGGKVGKMIKRGREENKKKNRAVQFRPARGNGKKREDSNGGKNTGAKQGGWTPTDHLDHWNWGKLGGGKNGDSTQGHTTRQFSIPGGLLCFHSFITHKGGVRGGAITKNGPW